MRSQIPRFRLPESVIDEEVGYILGLGVEFRGGQRIDSMQALLAEPWDAVFVGCGAPRGRDLDLPGRQEAAADIHIGIDWLASVSFGHIDEDRQARHRARRRQHGDGLLPLGAPPGRRRREGHRALGLRRDEGLAVGEGGRPARGHPDHQLPRAQGLPARGRAARRHALRDRAAGVRRQGPAPPGAHRRARRRCSTATRCWWRSGRRTPSPGSSATAASSSTTRACRCSTPVTLQSTPAARLLRRRRRLRPQEHHHRGGPRPRGGGVDRPLPARRGRAPAAAAARQPDVAEDGHPRVELPQRALRRHALQGALGGGREGAGQHPASRSNSASMPPPPSRKRSAA